MQTDPSIFEQKPVFDWNRVPVGRVASARRDPKTHDTRQLVLTLTPEAQKQLGTEEMTLELPASMIFGMRRDAVTLDRPISELRKIDRLTTILKK